MQNTAQVRGGHVTEPQEARRAAGLDADRLDQARRAHAPASADGNGAQPARRCAHVAMGRSLFLFARLSERAPQGGG